MYSCAVWIFVVQSGGKKLIKRENKKRRKKQIEFQLKKNRTKKQKNLKFDFETKLKFVIEKNQIYAKKKLEEIWNYVWEN